MRRTWLAAIALAGWMSSTAVAQDAKAVIANASKAMGADNLTSITFYGSGANFNLGQNNNANMPWPRTNINDYSRSIDFANSLSRATWQTYAVAVTGGAAALAPGQQNITAQNTAWAQQLDIWTTPWGFLKGAAANNATVKSQTVGGQRYQVLTWMTTQKSPGGPAYRVVGYISPRGLVDRVETWLGDPIFGDMLVEQIYTEYRDAN